MVLVDTSIWINFLRKSDNQLPFLLTNGEVVTHEFIIGELACGNIKNRQEFFGLFSTLPRVKTCLSDEIIYFIENNNLYEKGIGYIDMNLLASALVSNVKLWTIDKKLKDTATYFNINFL